MQKWFYFLLLLISVSVQAKANWSPLFMDRERFVELSEQDKEQVLIKTMELFVEMEGNYQKEMKTSGYSEERFKKFQKFVQKIQNFIISSAYAQVNSPGKKTANVLVANFTDLLDKLETGKTCIYGGFISIYVPLYANQPNGKKVCTHPGQIQGKKISSTDSKEVQASKKVFNELVQKVKAAYVGSNSPKCPEPDTISCNPLVFGYKVNNTDGNGIPFCVDTGNKNVDMKGVASTAESRAEYSKAHNASFQCMKKALTESPDADSREKRLDYLKSIMLDSPEIADKLHRFIFDTCVCGNTKTFNSEYVEYIKPHRTCYGMMNTLRVVNNQCSIYNVTTSNTEFAEKWAKYYTEAGSNIQLDKNPANIKFDKDWDEAYKSMINDSAVEALCNPKKEVIPVAPVINKPVVTTENKIKDCSLDVNSEEGSDKITVIVNFLGEVSEDEKKTLKWSEGGTSDPAKPLEKIFTQGEEELKVSASMEFTESDGKKVQKTCKEAIVPTRKPATNNDKKPKIEVSLKEETPTHSILIAKLTGPDDKEATTVPEGYTLQWYHKDGGGADAHKDSGEEKATTAVQTEGADLQTPSDAHGSKLEVTEKRLKKSYTVCAKLVPATGDAIEGGCEVVKPLVDAPAPYVPGPATPPPQFFVPSQNTRTDGVF